MEEHEHPLPIGTLVADAGSTKADRVLGVKGGSEHFRTKGVNPFFQDVSGIEKLLKEEGWGQETSSVDRVLFYGAGCSSNPLKQRVEEALARIYPDAQVTVMHDLLGAARAAAGDEPALIGILGTGSNACSYDGKEVLERSGGLGFILGDEGSGSHLGKMLLRDHLDAYLPEDIEASFRDRFPRSRQEHIDAIHRGPAPNRYLASFAPFLKEHLEHSQVRGMVRTAFDSFVKRHLLRFESAKEARFHVVGSIGHHFHPVLAEVLEDHGITPGRSLVEPIDGLIAYHGGV